MIRTNTITLTRRPRWKRILRSPWTFWLYWHIPRARTSQLCPCSRREAFKLAYYMTLNTWKRI